MRPHRQFLMERVPILRYGPKPPGPTRWPAKLLNARLLDKPCYFLEIKDLRPRSCGNGEARNKQAYTFTSVQLLYHSYIRLSSSVVGRFLSRCTSMASVTSSNIVIPFA